MFNKRKNTLDKTSSFKVIKIISDTQIIISAGMNDVKSDDILKVFTLSSEEITDPDSGKSLGFLEIVKTRIQVEHVYEKFSVCTGLQTKGISFDEPIEIGDHVKLL